MRVRLRFGQQAGMKQRMFRQLKTLFLLAASLCVSMTARIKWPYTEVSSAQHEKLLFERAMSHVEQHRFSSANLTLQTLINTYPDSEYASKAKQSLEDPRIAPTR
jgi:outer membrane protein assembly factor BamD